MIYKVDHIPKSSKNKRPGTKMTPQYLTIHSTGNLNSTAANERGWLTNPSNTRTASWHICVDEKEAVEAIPLTEVAYHAGTTAGNNTSIGIEICESGNRAKTLANAVELTANLLLKYGWGIDKLRRHYDWSGKICPRIMAANNWRGWSQFRQEVQKELNAMSNEPSKWAKNAWEWGIEQGLFDGTNPQGAVTREQLAAILERILKK